MLTRRGLFSALAGAAAAVPAAMVGRAAFPPPAVVGPTAVGPWRTVARARHFRPSAIDADNMRSFYERQRAALARLTQWDDHAGEGASS